MRVWISSPFMSIPAWWALAEVAEDLGLEGLCVADHVCVPEVVRSSYPYTGTSAELPPDIQFPEPLALVAALGARTTHLRFMTHALVVPLYDPVLLAREVATVASLLEGRFDLGVGIGWMAEEFDAVGSPFASRGSRLDEALPILRRLCRGETVGHRGQHFAFEPLTIKPTPTSPIRFYIGGHSPRGLRRAALHGDGWLGAYHSLEDLEGIVRVLDQERAAVGTCDRPFELRTGLRGHLRPDDVGRLARLGFDDLIVMSWQLFPEGAPEDPAELVDVVSARMPPLLEQAGS